MRCKACNRALSDFESTRKIPDTGEYLDLCNVCYHSIEDVVITSEREDLRGEEISDIDDFFDSYE